MNTSIQVADHPKDTSAIAVSQAISEHLAAAGVGLSTASWSIGEAIRNYRRATDVDQRGNLIVDIRGRTLGAVAQTKTVLVDLLRHIGVDGGTIDEVAQRLDVLVSSHIRGAMEALPRIAAEQATIAEVTNLIDEIEGIDDEEDDDVIDHIDIDTHGEASDIRVITEDELLAALSQQG